MNDELIKRLRDCTSDTEDCTGCPYQGGYKGTYCMNGLIEEAADAIEALSEYVNTMRRLKCEGWYLQQTKFHNGCQALTTMPLPEPPKKEET